MDLSTAIREGAKFRPQGKGHLFSRVSPHGFHFRGVDLSCALGAAFECLTGTTADGYDNEQDAYDALAAAFPALGRRVPTPCGGSAHGCIYNDGTLRTIIPHLNDQHDWTREQIADWIETL